MELIISSLPIVSKLRCSYLWLDFCPLAVLFEPGNINLKVKVTNIAADAVVTYLQKMLWPQNVTAPCSCHKDTGLFCCLIHGGHLKAWKLI